MERKKGRENERQKKAMMVIMNGSNGAKWRIRAALDR